ncbi:TPA: DUF1496 domain-containing protein [Aeromonas hydrophila]
MYLGKRVGGWLWLALLGGATGTGVAAEPKRAEVGAELVLPLGSLPERVCWYQDQKYSLGARIQQGDSWLECAPQRASDAAGKATKSGIISVGQ